MIHELDPMGVDNLRVAVVEQAAKDYLHALHALREWTQGVFRGRPLSKNAKMRLQSRILELSKLELFFKRDISFWVAVDGWSIRNELLRQSGMNEELLNALLSEYTNNKEERDYESKTGNGVRGHSGTEDVPRRQDGGQDVRMPDLDAYRARNDGVWGCNG